MAKKRKPERINVGDDIIDGLKRAVDYQKGNRAGARVYRAVNPAAIRARLGLSQEAFAKRFGLSVATVRNWEQGLRAPDATARALLQVIDREPEAAARALSDAA